MVDLPSKEQIRGARGLLDWSILDLAEAAGISISSVKRCEADEIGVFSPNLLDKIKSAFEKEGVLFLPDDGSGPGLRLCRRPNRTA